MLLFLKVLLSLLGTLIGLTAALLFLRSWATGLQLVMALPMPTSPSLERINSKLLVLARLVVLLLPFFLWSSQAGYHAAARTHARHMARRKQEKRRKAYLARLEQRPLLTLLSSDSESLAEGMGVSLSQAKSLQLRTRLEALLITGVAAGTILFAYYSIK